MAAKVISKARDATKLYDHLPPEARPAFHELLALGEHLREKQGWSTQQLQRLRGHTKESLAWSQPQADRPGRAILRIPLPASARPWLPAEHRLRARPEFYDFSLADQAADHGELLDRPLTELSYVVFDTETTGLAPTAGDEIISIGGVRIVGTRLLETEQFNQLVNPGRAIPRASMRFHGIRDAMVADKPPIEQILPQFKTFVGDSVLGGGAPAARGVLGRDMGFWGQCLCGRSVRGCRLNARGGLISSCR